MIYGYARVSTKGQAKDGNSLDAQKKQLKEAGAKVIFEDSFTGTKTDRPEFSKLLDKVSKDDKLIVTKLDRFARSATQGAEIMQALLDRGVTVHILNMGLIDNSPTGKLIRTIFFAFSEFERDMIIERTQEGKAIAKQNPNFKEGRPKKWSNDQIANALNLLEDHSYNQVTKITGISKSTLARAKRENDPQKESIIKTRKKEDTENALDLDSILGLL
ncbi:MAG: recombinase family protein [Lachnospiraceae bacterium]|nr:recombinase family protein [Lachnospiraceae bacterium]